MQLSTKYFNESLGMQLKLINKCAARIVVGEKLVKFLSSFFFVLFLKKRLVNNALK